MDPNEPKVIRPNSPVMDIQPQRPPVAPAPQPSEMGPADNIASVTQDPLQQPVQPVKIKKKRTGLIVGLVTGLVILLIGAGVAGFIIYKNDKPAPVVTETQSEAERVNVEEIDGTITEIDKTMNTLNDSNDVTPNDVTDTTLGL